MLEKQAYSYHGIMAKPKNERIKRELQKSDFLQLLAVVFFCFLIGRAVIFEEVAPFGVALLGALVHKRKYAAIAFASIGVGLVSLDPSGMAIKYVGAMALLWMYQKALQMRRIDYSRLSSGLGVFLSLGLTNMVYAYFRGWLTYDLILAVLESIVGFIMVYVFSHVVGALLEQKKRRILSNEEIICISIFTSLLIVGFWDMELLGMSIRNIFSVSFILVFAYIGGAGIGASIGLTIGMVLSLSSTPDPVMIGTLGVCGLVSGTFKELGRVGAGTAFILANALLTFYINKSTFVVLPFADIAASVVILILFPQRMIDFLKQFLDSTFVRLKEQNYYVKRMKELTVGRLNEFSQVFKYLAKSFERISDHNANAGQEDISKLMDLIADQVCSDCALYKNCWNRDFYNTYASMFELLTIAESNGRIDKDQIPAEWAKRCVRMNQVVEVLDNVYAMYRYNLRWQRKIDESRQLVGKQLDGISDVVTQLAAELDIDIGFKRDLEEAIQIELDKNAVRTKEVLVIEKSNGKVEVNISKKPCGGRRECVRQVERIVSQVMGKAMTNKVKECSGGRGECILHLEEAKSFQVLTGVARKAKAFKEVCGDSYSFTSIKDGRYMLALSDGMGSGVRAAEESGVVISLLENFLEAGFDLSLTMDTINSILMLRSTDEIFATVDLCVLDLVSAQAEFVKIGAVSTFIKREDKVEIIKAATLPIGILENIQGENIAIDLRDEDLIIMITDGVSDYIQEDEDAEAALMEIISSFQTRNPQEMADEIMKRILEQNGGQAKDDMTVMVSRVWQPL